MKSSGFLAERIRSRKDQRLFGNRGHLYSNSHQAFTLVELLATLVVVSLLMSILLTSVNKARDKADQVGCLNNIRQLQLAWLLYIDDHQGHVPENLTDNRSGIWRSTPNSWSGFSNALFDSDGAAIQQGTFFRLGYIRTLLSFRCPGDDSVVRTVNGKSTGIPRTRSYAMNNTFGGQNQQTKENFALNLSRASVFIDEHQDSIEDAHFLIWPAPDERWVNLPASRHNRNGVLSFADGHGEVWRWKAMKRFEPKESYWKRAVGEDLQDLRRLQSTVMGSVQ